MNPLRDLEEGIVHPITILTLGVGLPLFCLWVGGDDLLWGRESGLGLNLLGAEAEIPVYAGVGASMAGITAFTFLRLWSPPKAGVLAPVLLYGALFALTLGMFAGSLVVVFAPPVAAIYGAVYWAALRAPKRRRVRILGHAVSLAAALPLVIATHVTHDYPRFQREGRLSFLGETHVPPGTLEVHGRVEPVAPGDPHDSVPQEWTFAFETFTVQITGSEILVEDRPAGTTRWTRPWTQVVDADCDGQTLCVLGMGPRRSDDTGHLLTAVDLRDGATLWANEFGYWSSWSGIVDRPLPDRVFVAVPQHWSDPGPPWTLYEVRPDGSDMVLRERAGNPHAFVAADGRPHLAVEVPRRRPSRVQVYCLSDDRPTFGDYVRRRLVSRP